MNTQGFVRVAAAVSRVNVADCRANADSIISMCGDMADAGVRLAVFPELAVTGYTCGDLFLQPALIDSAYNELHRIAAATASLPIVAVVGVPLTYNDTLRNCGAVISGGEIKAVVGKTYLPNYGEFYERRWFRPMAENSTVFVLDGIRFGVELCEDMWAPVPPSSRLAIAGAEIILNLSASNALTDKRNRVLGIVRERSAVLNCAYVYASAGYGESTTDLVFDGQAFIAENGDMLAESARWQREAFYETADVDIDLLRAERVANSSFADCAERELTPGAIKYVNVTPATEGAASAELLRRVDPHPFVPSDSGHLARTCDEIAHIQCLGLIRRMEASRSRTAVVGISGGLDSTLALLVACQAFDMCGRSRKDIIAVTMPGFGTSGRTRSNAHALMEALGVTVREIPIAREVNQHFSDIGHDPAKRDVTYENTQARIRTLILMDLANETGGIVLGTGDLSELALGWATYNGDHMSMYGVNASVPKTLIPSIVEWFGASNPAIAPVLADVVATPVSPELLPAAADDSIAQKTEDLVGPYELHDFFLYHFLRLRRKPAVIYRLARVAFGEKYSRGEIKRWLTIFLRRFFAQQFKRSCMPDGPKVGGVGLSPRGDWRMPSDAEVTIWLAELESAE